MVDLLSGERQFDDPSAADLFPACPTFVDCPEVVEPFANDGAEGRTAAKRVCLHRGVYGNIERGHDNELTLSQHRTVEFLNVVERYTGDRCDILR